MDILKVLVIIAFVLVTICTIKLHPTMHQQMIIEDANFILTRISDNLPNASEIPTKESTAKSQYSIEEATKEELKMALTELERTQNEIAEYNSEVIMANLEMHNLDGVVREEQSYGGDAHDYPTPEIRYLRAMTMQ